MLFAFWKAAAPEEEKAWIPPDQCESSRPGDRMTWLFHWLNENTGAVTAIAAMIQACVTLALVVLTTRYVRLTNRIAAATQQQADVIAVERDERLRNQREALGALIGQLRKTLADLPDHAPSDVHVAGVTLWPDDTLAKLLELTTEAPGVDPRVAERAVAALRWIGERVAGIRSGGETENVLAAWPEQREEARKNLEGLARQAETRPAVRRRSVVVDDA